MRFKTILDIFCTEIAVVSCFQYALSDLARPKPRMAAGLRARARKRDDGWSGRGRSGQNERAPGATRDATNVSTVRVPPTSRAEASTKRGNPPQLLSRRSRRSWQKSVHAAQSVPVTVTGPKLSTWATSSARTDCQSRTRPRSMRPPLPRSPRKSSAARPPSTSVRPSRRSNPSPPIAPLALRA